MVVLFVVTFLAVLRYVLLHFTAGVGGFFVPLARYYGPALAGFSCLQCGPGGSQGGDKCRPPKKKNRKDGAGSLADRLHVLDKADYRGSPTPSNLFIERALRGLRCYVYTPLIGFLRPLCLAVALAFRIMALPLFFLFYLVGRVLSFFWRLVSLDWVFLQFGRVGFYLFFKNASSSGIPLWIYTSGATSTILAFPLFFFYTLPDRLTRYLFGMSWGSGFLKYLVGFTGFVVYLHGAWPILWLDF